MELCNDKKGIVSPGSTSGKEKHSTHYYHDLAKCLNISLHREKNNVQVVTEVRQFLFIDNNSVQSRIDQKSTQCLLGMKVTDSFRK